VDLSPEWFEYRIPVKEDPVWNELMKNKDLKDRSLLARPVQAGGPRAGRILTVWLGLGLTLGLGFGVAGCGGSDSGARASETIPAPPDVATVPDDATVTASGLAYRVLEKGPESGVFPTLDDDVTVHYTGWTTDGAMFDSSVPGGDPVTFPLGRLIAGWQEGIQLMQPGDRFRFWIPGALAYDNSPRPDAPRGTLVFDVELRAVPAR
jgi:hypothetical protein